MLTITGHAWLARNTGWDQNDLGALQACLDTVGVWLVAFDLGFRQFTDVPNFLKH